MKIAFKNSKGAVITLDSSLTLAEIKARGLGRIELISKGTSVPEDAYVYDPASTSAQAAKSLVLDAMIEKTEFGFTGSITDLPGWAQKNPELGVVGALVATNQFEATPDMYNVVQSLVLFEKARQRNPYLYFELAYTRQTDWMCWVIDRTGGERVVLVQGQGPTPNEACVTVVPTLRALL